MNRRSFFCGIAGGIATATLGIYSMVAPRKICIECELSSTLRNDFALHKNDLIANLPFKTSEGGVFSYNPEHELPAVVWREVTS